MCLSSFKVWIDGKGEATMTNCSEKRSQSVLQERSKQGDFLSDSSKGTVTFNSQEDLFF